MRIKLIFTTVVAVTLATLASTPASALYEQVNRNVNWYDRSELGVGIIYKTTSSGNGFSNAPCDNGWTDCDPIKGDAVTISNALADCATVAAGTPCLENAWIREVGTTNWIEGLNNGPLVDQPTYAFAAKPTRQVGASNPSNRFTFPGVNHGAGDSFAINPVLTSTISAYGSVALGTKLTIMASAVTLDASAGVGACYIAYGNMGTCYKDVANPPAYEYKIAVRLQSTPKGWITGRIASPDYSVEEGLSGGAPVRFTIAGAPVQTPGVERNYWYNDLADRAAWDALNSVWNVPWDFPGLGIVSAGPQVGPTHLREFMDAVAIDHSFDTADEMHWVLRADVEFAPAMMYSCQADKLVGLIASNSMTYASEFPTLSSSTLTLDYKVASPHFTPANSVFSGIYEMRLDAAYAQCIWSSALNGASLSFVPGDSTVSVLAADGTTKTAVTNVSLNNGIIAFTASGFTFSQNTIKARLGNPKKKTITCLKATKSKSVTAYVPKCPSGYKIAKKIVCIKGSRTKTVLAISPKCPAGWRKKA